MVYFYVAGGQTLERELRLVEASTCTGKKPEILYFVMPRWITALSAVAGGITEIIEGHAECIRNRFFRFSTLVTGIKTQIDIVVDNIERLTKYKKELELQLTDEEAVDKINAEWRDIAVLLKDMFDMLIRTSGERGD